MGVNLDQYRAGSSEPWTADILCAFLHATEPARILELGTFEGLTTKRLAQTAEDFGGHITTVEGDYDRFKVAERSLREYENVTCLLRQLPSYLRFYDGEPFQFAFVDDDHTASHVREELALLKPLISPGGLIFVHDVDGPFGLDAVVREAGGYCLKLPKLHVAGGLGIVQC